jgi:predicted CXXCH cytochrome family protein
MKARLLALGMLAVLVAAPAYAQKASVLNTAHDLRTNKTVGDACIACHTPHNANTGYQALLWVRAVRTTGFQVYDSTVNPDFRGGTVDLTGGNKVSLLCLSCHDGGAALNATWTGGTNSALTAGAITGGALIGSDLRNDHPIGFSYAATVAAKPADYNAADANGVVSGNVKVFAGRVECASCHNVHSATFGNFLVRSNDNSALCLSCHR